MKYLSCLLLLLTSPVHALELTDFNGNWIQRGAVRNTLPIHIAVEQDQLILSVPYTALQLQQPVYVPRLQSAGISRAGSYVLQGYMMQYPYTSYYASHMQGDTLFITSFANIEDDDGVVRPRLQIYQLTLMTDTKPNQLQYRFYDANENQTMALTHSDGGALQIEELRRADGESTGSFLDGFNILRLKQAQSAADATPFKTVEIILAPQTLSTGKTIRREPKQAPSPYIMSPDWVTTYQRH